MERDEAILLDIAKAARLTVTFTENVTEDTFLNDSKTQSAVLYQLTLLGEAVKRLSREWRDQHPTIPWSLIAGMRDHLIHGYDSVDLAEVWQTATRDIPNLLRDLDPLLPQESDKKN